MLSQNVALKLRREGRDGGNEEEAGKMEKLLKAGFYAFKSLTY